MKNKRLCWVCWIVAGFAASVAAVMAISGCTVQEEPPTEYAVEVEAPTLVGTTTADQVPKVESWNPTTEKNPLRNGRFIIGEKDRKAVVAERVSFRGVAITDPNDPLPVAAELIFLQNPANPDEYGAIWRYKKNFTSDWTVFIKCWGIRRVDGGFHMARGDSRSSNDLQFAILLEDGRWEVSPPYTDMLVVIWNSWGFNYDFVYADDNEKRESRGSRVLFD